MSQLICISAHTNRKLCLRGTDLCWSNELVPLPVKATANGLTFANGDGSISVKTSDIETGDTRAPKVITVCADVGASVSHTALCLHKTPKDRHYLLGTKNREAALVDCEGYETVVIQQPPAVEHMVYFETNKASVKTEQELMQVAQQQRQRTPSHLIARVDPSCQEQIRGWMTDGTLRSINDRARLFVAGHSAASSTLLSLMLRKSNSRLQHAPDCFHYTDSEIDQYKQIADAKAAYIVAAPLAQSSTVMLYHSLGGATAPRTWVPVIAEHNPQRVIINAEDSLAVSIIPSLAERRIAVIVTSPSLDVNADVAKMQSPYVYVQAGQFDNIVRFNAANGAKCVVVVRADKEQFIDGPHESCLLHNPCFCTELLNMDKWKRLTE